MCENTAKAKDSNPASELAQILNNVASGYISAEQVRRLISTKWERIKVLAHHVHDEETAEERLLKEAIKTIAGLSEDGIRNVINGRASASVIKDFKLLAAKVR